MSLGLFHLHARKHARKLVPHPAPSPLMRGFDYLMYGVAILAPLAALPQVIAIFASKQVTGLVLASWIMMAVINVLWIIYGLVHRTFPVWINASLWFLLNGAVAVGIILYS